MNMKFRDPYILEIEETHLVHLYSFLILTFIKKTNKNMLIEEFMELINKKYLIFFLTLRR